MRYLVLIFILFVSVLKSQTKDTIPKKVNYKQARKAAIFSTILPGLGQGYNKKYWKIPIIYGGIAGLGYLALRNQANYAYYRKNLLALTDEDPNTTNEIPNYDQSGLQSEKLRYKKNRDFSIIGVAGIYVLNIIDANVDGHLKTFDVGDDLSLQIKPVFVTNLGYAAGLKIKLTFK